MLDTNLPRCLCKKLLLDCLDTGSLLFKSVKTHSLFSAAMQSFPTSPNWVRVFWRCILLLVCFVASASSIISIIFHILCIFHLSMKPLLSSAQLCQTCLYHTNLYQICAFIIKWANALVPPTPFKGRGRNSHIMLVARELGGSCREGL